MLLVKKVSGVRFLWDDDWYDGPVSGLAEFEGNQYWYPHVGSLVLVAQTTHFPHPGAHADAPFRVRQLAAAVALVVGLAACGADRHALQAGAVTSSGSDTTSTQPDTPCEPNMPVSGDTDAGPGSLPPAVERTFVECVRPAWDVRGPLTVTYVQTTDGQARQYADPTSPNASVPVFVLFLKGPFNLLAPGGVGRGGGPSPPTSVYGVIATDGHPVLIAGWGSPDDYDLSKLGAPQSTVIDFGDTSETTTTPP